MAVDMLVDSTALDAALTATANAIRTKGGTSAQIAFDDETGFASAVTAIPTGGGLPTGLNAIAYGTFTPASANTTFVVTHNLGVNPKGCVIWITPNGRTGVDYDDTTPLTVGNMGIMSAFFQNPAINNTKYITSEIGTLGEKSSIYGVCIRFGASGGVTAASVAVSGGITEMDSTTFKVTQHSSSFTITTNTFNYIIWG